MAADSASAAVSPSDDGDGEAEEEEANLDFRRPERAMSAPVEPTKQLSPEQALRRRKTETMREARQRKFSNNASRNDGEGQ